MCNPVRSQECFCPSVWEWLSSFEHCLESTLIFERFCSLFWGPCFIYPIHLRAGFLSSWIWCKFKEPFVLKQKKTYCYSKSVKCANSSYWFHCCSADKYLISQKCSWWTFWAYGGFENVLKNTIYFVANSTRKDRNCFTRGTSNSTYLCIISSS